MRAEKPEGYGTSRTRQITAPKLPPEPSLQCPGEGIFLWAQAPQCSLKGILHALGSSSVFGA
jgi:hypothetical protein